MKWIKIPTGKKPEQEQEIFLDGGEDPPAWGRFRTKGKFDYIVTIDSSGEENLNLYTDYVRWLDEFPSSPSTREGAKSKELVEALEKIAELLLGEPSEENVSDAFIAANEALSSYWNPE